MDSDSITSYVIILVVLVFLSAFFSATETAFTSLNKTRLKLLAEDGKKSSSLALELTEKYDKLLFSILIGNNIVNIAMATISTLLFSKLIVSQNLSATVSTLVSTVVVLVFGEITPKTLAKEFPEKFASAVSYLIYAVIIVLTPLSLLFSGWKKLLKLVFRFKSEDKITEEELLTYVEEANEDGTLTPAETELISGAIEFDDVEVGDILVPRVNVVAIEKSTPVAEIKKMFLDNGFSRLPVYNDTIDSIIGMIHEKDFYAMLESGKTDISGIVTSMAMATEHMKISTLLKSMQKQKVHMASVIDEYGGTLGIVTLEDILEELVGEIWDEHDEVVNYFNKLSDDTYEVDCDADLNDFFDLFDVEDEDADSNTVGGWVAEKCQGLPPLNYSFDYENINITIMKKSQKRILQIKVVIKNTEIEKTND